MCTKGAILSSAKNFLGSVLIRECRDWGPHGGGGIVCPDSITASEHNLRGSGVCVGYRGWRGGRPPRIPGLVRMGGGLGRDAHTAAPQSSSGGHYVDNGPRFSSGIICAGNG